MNTLNRDEILNSLIALAKDKGYSQYAYSFGVISTYLTEENLKNLQRFVDDERKILEKGNK